MKRKPGGALSAEKLVKSVSNSANKIQDNTTKNKPEITLHDNIMSALAMFKLGAVELSKFTCITMVTR